jgi:hypothetical protein
MTVGNSFTDRSDPMPSDDAARAQRQAAARRANALRGIEKIMANRKERRERWRAEAPALWEKWKDDPLFMLGVGLYWGEGEKASRGGKGLALSNADPNLLRTWLRWCARFVPGVHLNSCLSIHDDCDLEAARAFWRRELNIEVTWVSVAVSRASKRKRKTLPHGTLKISLGRGSLEWHTKMLVWLELAHGLQAC